MTKYFMYIRKSTDEDGKQVLSLESQKAELLEFAQREHLDIVDSFTESQTAKEPGRPAFNHMLERIERGEAEGILAWHPDRLARNSIDGGKIIFLVDSEKIKALKFPTFWFEPTPQGKFMLNIAFGQSKYFVDNLSENTKRGLRQKLRRGEMPGPAPLGYLNDLRTHTIVKDPDRFRLVKKLFALYANGTYSMKDLQKFSKSFGLLSRNGNVLPLSTIQHLLQNPFYYGLFKYKGEIYQGAHKPMITKKLFEKCQKVMADRSRPKKLKQKQYAFRGLFKCGECGCSITSETQKGHSYYRCTKKRIPCSQPYAREELLAKQISDILQKVSLPQSWAEKMLAKLDKEQEQENDKAKTFAQNLKLQIKQYEDKLDKLLDTHLDETITKDEYLAKKQKILNQKVAISEKLKDFEQKGNHWLELCKNFISEAKQAKIIALQKNLFEKRDFLKKIGSNRILRERKVYINPKNEWKILWNFSAERQSREAQMQSHTMWLRRADSNRRHTGYTLS
ncbi:recombinase family protein [Candidatus Microgenomates bacterium]|nr:recombinase family protein [Candidatus Microgenomates bacterium]